MSFLFAAVFTVAVVVLLRGWRCRHRQMIVVRLNAGTWAACWCGRRVERCDAR